MAKKNEHEFIKRWKKRPYSWSQHSSWAWSPEQWFMGYIIEAKREASGAMEFGNVVGRSIAEGKPLVQVPTQSHFEYEVFVKLNKIPLIGFFDSYDPVRKMLEEYKTSSNPNKWDQESVDGHGQLTFYAMLLYLRDRIKPEQIDMQLTYIPVGEGQDFSMSVTGKPKTFKTKRTMKQVMDLMVEIQKRRREMEKYAVEMLEEYEDANASL